MTVAGLRQPPPERCDTPEQALAVILLDPSDTNTHTAYATGWLDGYLAGLAYDLLNTLTTSQDDTRLACYNSSHGPLPLDRALTATDNCEHLALIGWLQGWADATLNSTDALTCEVCDRRLFADLDDPHYCRITGVYGCATDLRDCWRAFCGMRAGRHVTECVGD